MSIWLHGFCDEWEGWVPVNRFKRTSWMAVVASTMFVYHILRPLHFGCLLVVSLYKEKKEQIWLNPMTKPLSPQKTPKKQCDNTQTPPKTSITQRLVTDFRRSGGVLTAIKLVLLNPNLPTNRKSRVRTRIEKIVNNPPYKGQGQTTK